VLRWIVEAERAEGAAEIPVGACDDEGKLYRSVQPEPPMATLGGARVRLREVLKVIRVDAAWFAVEPLDMRAGVDTALARVVSVFGQAQAHMRMCSSTSARTG
jgi:hypothetical protein